MGRPLELQQPFADRPPLIDRADDIVVARQRIFEQGLVERRIAADQADRPHCDATLAHVDEDQADPFVLRRVRVGAHQREDEVALHRIRGPQLAAVDHVVVAVAHGFAGQTRQVRAGARLGIPHAPAAFAPGAARQPARLLRIRAELEDGRPDVVHAAAGQRRACIDAPHFLHQHEIFIPRQTGAAVLPRPRGHGPALRDHAVQPQAGRGFQAHLRAAPRYLPGAARPGRAVVGQPLARRLAKLVEIRHGHSLAGERVTWRRWRGTRARCRAGRACRSFPKRCAATVPAAPTPVPVP